MYSKNIVALWVNIDRIKICCVTYGQNLLITYRFRKKEKHCIDFFYLSQNPLLLDNVTPDVFGVILHFIYTEEIPDVILVADFPVGIDTMCVVRSARGFSIIFCVHTILNRSGIHVCVCVCIQSNFVISTLMGLRENLKISEDSRYPEYNT